MTSRVATEDVRQIFRLSGECRELAAAGERPNRHFLTGLARITRSQVAIQMDASDVRLETAPTVGDVFDIGWPSGGDRDRVYGFVATHSMSVDPLTAAALRRQGRLVTMTRADAVSTREWERTELRNDVHLAAGVDDSLLSLFRKAEDGHVRALILKRGRRERVFDAGDRELVDLVHGECSWVFDAPTEPHAVLDGKWSPRARDTLRLLLTGASEKSIAAALRLSPHTVHDYVKAIYRQLGVASRAELMSVALQKKPPPATRPTPSK